MREVLCKKCKEDIRFNRSIVSFVNLKKEYVETGAEATGIEFAFKCETCNLEHIEIIELKKNDYYLSAFIVDLNSSYHEFWGSEKVAELYFDLMKNAEDLRTGKVVY